MCRSSKTLTSIQATCGFGLEALQRFALCQRHPSRATVEDEVELFEMRARIGTIPGGRTCRLLEHALTLIIAHGLRMTSCLLCQFADPPVRCLGFSAFLLATQRFRLQIGHLRFRGNRKPCRGALYAWREHNGRLLRRPKLRHHRHACTAWACPMDRAVYQRCHVCGGRLDALLAHSTSLLADALDMFGDALVYGFSLFVLTRSARCRLVAVGKGGFMLLFGLGVLGEALYKSLHPIMPGVEMMGIIGALLRWPRISSASSCCTGIVAPISTCVRRGCAPRNDLMANVGVLMAAASSSLLTSRWPDILVGVMIASVVLHAALEVLRPSLQALRLRRTPAGGEVSHAGQGETLQDTLRT